MIPVTKPFLPPIEEYEEYVKQIWKRQWLTNNGPLVNELELRLKELLGVPHLLYVGNGTIALQIAIKALDLKGEIITTPFSYVATTSSIVWENCKPIFVDIDAQTLNIDPSKIEQAITPETSAILATHVYGNPCDIDTIQEVADKYGLKVIYDAAHCFGTKYKGKSVFSYGDISTTSFHATKLFHTVEGGAIFTNNSELFTKLTYLRNFGHEGPENFAMVGVNGKNSELHAAAGLANLKYIDAILAKRRDSYSYYVERIGNLDIKFLKINKYSDFNCAYMPVLFNSEEELIKMVNELNKNWIYPRRYFFPSLSSLCYVERQVTPIADDVSKRVLCLPLYFDLQNEEIDLVCNILSRIHRYDL